MRRVETKSVETGGYITTGSIVTYAGSSRSDQGFSLQLGFSDGSTLYAEPTPESCEFTPQGDAETDDLGEVEISDWEILTPNQRILKVGPGPRWSYLDSKRKRSG